MTKREAAALVKSIVATTLENDVCGLGAEWIHSDDAGNRRSTSDVVRIETAALAFVRKLRRRHVE